MANLSVVLYPGHLILFSHSCVPLIESWSMKSFIILRNKEEFKLYFSENKQEIYLGEFTMVSQPIRLILVDWFVFHFIFLGRLPFLFIF